MKFFTDFELELETTEEEKEEEFKEMDLETEDDFYVVLEETETEECDGELIFSAPVRFRFDALIDMESIPAFDNKNIKEEKMFLQEPLDISSSPKDVSTSNLKFIFR